TFALPDYAPQGILDLNSGSSGNGQRARFDALNHALAETVTSIATTSGSSANQILLLDQERAEARFGKRQIRDWRLWYLGSLPFSEGFLPTLAGEQVRFVRAITGLTRKCIVLDLDNTLWGGVLGEDGLARLKLGGTAAPGNAFLDFQHALKALSQRGILLALCSKNNEPEVMSALAEHPDMVLRRGDFSAVRINWNSKAANIAEIARELNIGLDSLVFLDDNPAERALVRQELPDVLTVEMPRDPALYTRTLLALDVFEAVRMTEEDSRRAALYQEEQARRQFQSGMSAPEDSNGIDQNVSSDINAYLTGLEMRVQIASATPFTLPRIAQLTNKTNQFNVTTRRYTETQMAAMVADSARWQVYSITVADRFGDSGLTGVAVIDKSADSLWEIDSFLLSCRVLGRGVEDALLCHLIKSAQQNGVRTLRGRFIRTAKNAPAADFYQKQRFSAVTPSELGEIDRTEIIDETVWEMALDSPEAQREYPYWMSIVSDESFSEKDSTINL
ncbi:MAG: HAD-IIIC family phosphatase, partial [Armatimonadota bacterium]